MKIVFKSFKDHLGRPGQVGGSLPKGGSSSAFRSTDDEERDALIGRKTLPSKGMYVKFDGHPNYHKFDGTDKSLESALKKIEKAIGKKLELDPKSDFPSFTYYEDGEEMGGG